MTTVLFDTLEAAKRLEDAGFNPVQTEALVKTMHNAVNEGAATKTDLEVGLMRTEHRITLRVGVMLAVAVATILAGAQILVA